MRRFSLTVLLAGTLTGGMIDRAFAEPLPQPLSLQQALQIADAGHPEIAAASAELDVALARQQAAIADSDSSLTLTARARLVEPSYVSSNPDHNDSSARLLLRKRLHDFGRSEARESAAAEAVSANRWQLLSSRQQLQLQVMARFFDVLLADLAYARDNEAMSIGFVRWDKGRDRNELGQLSDVDLLQLETTYQHTREQLYRSQAAQRLTRARLASALNRPDDLPADLTPPVIDSQRKPPSHEQLLQQALAGNPQLKSLRARIASARQQLAAAEAGGKPTLYGELSAAAYNRTTSSTHPLAGGLVLEMPLYQGGRTRAEAARARAELARSEAELARSELALREQLTELWLRLDSLQAEIQSAQTRADYRELYLDRSRALYELEVTSDLGDAMTETSRVRHELAAARYEYALTWAKLDALRGNLLDTTPSGQKETNQ